MISLNEILEKPAEMQEDYTAQEIGWILGKKVNTVYTLL